MLLFNKYFYRKNKLKLYFGNCVTILNKFILPNQGVYKHVLIQLSKTFFSSTSTKRLVQPAYALKTTVQQDYVRNKLVLQLVYISKKTSTPRVGLIIVRDILRLNLANSDRCDN
jgi:hypothetical protein